MSWHEQRKQARKRWLGDSVGITEVAHDPAQDAAARSSIARDHIRTQVLLNEAKPLHASPLMALLAVLLIAGVGITVWLGQGDKPIQTGISQTVNCAAALSEGANWMGCAKRGLTRRQGPQRQIGQRFGLDDAPSKAAIWLMPRSRCKLCVMRNCSGEFHRRHPH